MKKRILIIDDDVSIRTMLRYIINKNSLGDVIGELSTGDDASKWVDIYNPDIVLIDFLLPGKDGIKIMEECSSLGYRGKFVMISQVKDSDMVGEAYRKGIVFFINKPINEIEVMSVLKNIVKNIEIETSMEIIKNTLVNINPPREIKNNINEDLMKVFSDLGIISEFGINDLKNVILSIVNLKKTDHSYNYQLKEIFHEVVDNYKKNDRNEINFKSFDQRIRRIVYKAFENICQRGSEDFYDHVFTEYSSILFDIGEVRKVMSSLDGKEVKKGKINLKKFIEGIISKIY